MRLQQSHFINEIERIPEYRYFGRVTAVLGLLVEVGGVERLLSIGGRCTIVARAGRRVPCEVVGFRQGRALLMPLGGLDGVGLGCKAEVTEGGPEVFPDESWLGRVVNALGEPIDGKGPLLNGKVGIPIRNNPPPAHSRRRVGEKIDLGVRAMNTFLSCCRGQRMGIFAGSGVGKSSLLSMLARAPGFTTIVIGLVGERGREVREFLDDTLGPMRAQAVAVVSTSDESAMMRRLAPNTAMAVAEYFRDQGEDVLLILDSVTRLAHAARDVALAAGEPAVARGYTPSVFSTLPKLLERAGPGVEGTGTITGIFSVLIDGDDHNDPVADSIRGTLDGHLVLDRAIADQGRYPAVNVLGSVSRLAHHVWTPEQRGLASRMKALISRFEDTRDLRLMGGYQAGADAELDKAIVLVPKIYEALHQEIGAALKIGRAHV